MKIKSSFFQSVFFSLIMIGSTSVKAKMCSDIIELFQELPTKTVSKINTESKVFKSETAENKWKDQFVNKLKRSGDWMVTGTNLHIRDRSFVRNPLAFEGEIIAGIRVGASGYRNSFIGKVLRVREQQGYYLADVLTMKGYQKVDFSHIDRLHVLKSKGQKFKSIEGSLPQMIDNREYKNSPPFLISRSYQTFPDLFRYEAKHELAVRLNRVFRNHPWKSLGSELEHGTRVENPSSLIGKVIQGIKQGKGNTLETFVGEVTEVKWFTAYGGASAVHRLKVLGPLGYEYVYTPGSYNLKEFEGIIF